MTLALSFPPEIWDNVLRALPHSGRRTCLSVSRLLHDVAQRLLFQSLAVDFGIWETLKPGNIETDNGDSPDDLLAHAARRTNGLLTRIARDPAFAQVVRQLTVHSFSQKETIDEESKLIAALRALPHLRSFKWFGTFPSIPYTVAHEIVRTCTQLDELRIPAKEKPSPSGRFDGLTSLTSFAVVCQLGIDNRDGYWPEDIAACSHEMVRIIEANAGTLRRLRVFGSLLYELPAALCARLTHFDIWGPKKLHDLGAIPTHATRLISLTLVELTCQDVFPLLGAHPGTFPELLHLKLMSLDMHHAPEPLAALARFVRAKPRLRRLDLDLPGSERVSVMEMLGIVSNLHALEAFGMDLRTLTDEDDLPIISSRLPGNLRAIHLQTCWENLPLDTPEMTALLDRFADLPHLELLHLETLFAAESEAAEELAFAIPQLRIVALGAHCWEIDRSRGLPNVTMWTKKQVAFRTRESLGAVGEWLLCYHGLS